MRDEGPDFLARQVVAMIEEMGAESTGAEPCKTVMGHDAFAALEVACIDCGAVV